MKLHSKHLQVTVDVERAVFDVIQTASGTRWRMDRDDQRDLVVHYYGRDERVLSLSKARRKTATVLDGGSAGRLEFADFPGVGSSLSVSVVLHVHGSSLIVELDVNDADPNYVFESLYWPRSFVLPDRKDACWLFPIRGGALLPATHRVNQDARLGWRPTLKCHGALQGKAGFLCLWDTPWDIYLGQTNSRKTGPQLMPRLRASLNRFGYTRRLRFVFRESTDHADLIREVYRPWAMRCGYVRTLKEKAAENAKINSLAGGMIFHQLIGYTDRRSLTKTEMTFAQAAKTITRVAKATGVRGCYHLDGWCRQGYDALHPDVFPPSPTAGGQAGLVKLARAVKRLGLHFGLHDNYLLFFPDAERYRDRHAVFGPDLEPVRDQFRAGGMNFVQSPPAAREFAIQNYLTGQNILRRRWPPAAKTYNLEFCYFDQYLLSGGSVEEDFNPAHPLTRQQFAIGMLEVMRVMRDRIGWITSSEHMFDYGVPLYDVNGNSEGLAPMPPEDGLIPAPLWNLAFHECMVVTHAMTADRATNPAAMTMTGLIGGLLHHRSNRGYGGGQDGGDDRDAVEAIEQISQAEPLRRLHVEVMHKQCTASRITSADGTCQQVEFEDITVSADLSRHKLDVSGSKAADGCYDFSSAGG